MNMISTLRQISLSLLVLVAIWLAVYLFATTVLALEADRDCHLDGWSGGTWTLGKPVCWQYHSLRPSTGGR